MHTTRPALVLDSFPTRGDQQREMRTEVIACIIADQHVDDGAPHVVLSILCPANLSFREPASAPSRLRVGCKQPLVKRHDVMIVSFL